MTMTLMKIVKSEMYEGIFIEPFLRVLGDFNKIVIFLESETPNKVEQRGNIIFYHSPFSDRKSQRSKQIRWVAGLMKKYHVKVVHCDQHSPTVIGVKAALQSGKPVLFSHVHGCNICRGFARKLFYWRYRHYIQLIACSDFVAENIKKINPGFGNGKRILAIDNAVNIDKFNPSLVSQEIITQKRLELNVGPNDCFFLTTCRLVEDKNLFLLIQAFARAVVDFPHIKLRIAGEGKLRNKLERLIQELKMEQQITLLGFRKDIKELLASCDVVIQPSRSEGFSVAILEAAAMKKPIIYTQTGGAKLLQGICDQFVIPPNQEEAIYQAIKTFLQSPPKEIESIKEKLYQRVQTEYNYSRLDQQYQDLYQGK